MSDQPSVIGRALTLGLFPLVMAAFVGTQSAWAQAKAPAAATPAGTKPLELSLLPDYAIAGGLESRTETVERTLFNPTRRPAPTASPAAQEAARPRMQRGQFTLTGTTMAPEGKNTAFLREVNGGKSRRVSEGDTINGLRVAEVTPDRVKLTMGDEQEELHLKVLANPRPTPAASPSVAQAAPAAAAPAAGRVVPVPPQAAAPTPPQGISPSQQSLIERRRAARAAAAAEQGRTEGSGDQRTRAVPPQGGSSGPPSWGDVFRSYQQRGGAGGASQ